MLLFAIDIECPSSLALRCSSQIWPIQRRVHPEPTARWLSRSTKTSTMDGRVFSETIHSYTQEKAPKHSCRTCRNSKVCCWDLCWIQHCCSNSLLYDLYCQQQYTGNQLRHKLNPVRCSSSPRQDLYCQQQYTGNQLRHKLNPVRCSSSPRQDLYCQQQYTGNQLRHKLNPVLLQQLTPAGPPLPATIHRQPTETQVESSTLQQLTTAGPLLPATIYRQPTETQADSSTLQQLTTAGPLLPATIHREPTETQAESSTAAATHPSRTSTASNNTQATNWDTSWIQYCCSNSPQQDLHCQQQYTGNQLRHKLNPVLLQQLAPAGPPLPATIHEQPTETQAESSTAAATHPSRTSTVSSTMHREPNETQAESSTAAATHHSRTSTASNNTQQQTETQAESSTLQQLTTAGPPLPATIHSNKLRHKLNPVRCSNSPQQDLHCQQQYTATNWDTSSIQYCCSNSPQQDLPCQQQYTGNKLRHKLNPVLLQQLNQAGPLLPAAIHRQRTETQAKSSIAAATHPSRTSTASNNTQETNWDTS